MTRPCALSGLPREDSCDGKGPTFQSCFGGDKISSEKANVLAVHCCITKHPEPNGVTQPLLCGATGLSEAALPWHRSWCCSPVAGGGDSSQPSSLRCLGSGDSNRGGPAQRGRLHHLSSTAAWGQLDRLHGSTGPPGWLSRERKPDGRCIGLYHLALEITQHRFL